MRSIIFAVGSWLGTRGKNVLGGMYRDMMWGLDYAPKVFFLILFIGLMLMGIEFLQANLTGFLLDPAFGCHYVATPFGNFEPLLDLEGDHICDRSF